MGGIQGHWLSNKQDRAIVFTCNTTIWEDFSKTSLTCGWEQPTDSLPFPAIEISVKYPKATVDKICVNSISHSPTPSFSKKFYSMEIHLVQGYRSVVKSIDRFSRDLIFQSLWINASASSFYIPGIVIIVIFSWKQLLHHHMDMPNTQRSFETETIVPNSICLNFLAQHLKKTVTTLMSH